MNEFFWDLAIKIAAIGSIALLILAIYTGIKKLIKGYINKTRLKGLEGTWHEYHWTNPGGTNTEFKWLHSTLEAEPKFLSSYKLLYTNNNIPFYGIARYIDRRDDELSGDILLKVRRKKDPVTSKKETIYFRYNVPERQFGDNNDEIAGIWLSYNFGKDITSGASILSRNKIPQNELDAKFDEYFTLNKVSIVVRRDDTPKNSTSNGKKPWWQFW